MSGSSLDGLDIAYCHIEEKKGKWSFKILKSKCATYDRKWKLRLGNLALQNANTYIKTHTFYGHYMGGKVASFIEEESLQGKVDFIASHGQTIFHQPSNRLTSQIGDGNAIAAICKLPVIFDFRTVDVAMGGQGAPIAPIVDKYLFPDHRFCLNLGGIGNISYKQEQGGMIAFDNCGVNLILNHLAGEKGMDYDKDGNMARGGQIDDELLKELNNSWYYEKEYPKSLSEGWVNKVILPILHNSNISIDDKLHTYCEHIGIQIARDIEMIYSNEGGKGAKDTLLITGGGGLNTFLVERIKEHSPISIEIPDKEIIDFKEALLMALMGVLRVRNEVNCLSSVTGASRDTIGGVICQGDTNILED